MKANLPKGPFPEPSLVWPYEQGKEHLPLLAKLFDLTLRKKNLEAAVRVAVQTPRGMLKEALSSMMWHDSKSTLNLRLRLVHDTQINEGYRIDCLEALREEHGYEKKDLIHLVDSFSAESEWVSILLD